MTKMRSQRRILFICDHSMHLVGGSQESLKVVMDGIKHDYSVSLYTPGMQVYEDPSVCHYHYSKYDSMKTMLPHPVEFAKYYLKLMHNIRREKYDIIHTQEQVGYFTVALMRRMRLIDRNIVLIHTERGLLEKYNRLFRRMFYLSLRYTDVLLTTTEYNRIAWEKAIEEKLQYKNVKCILIENTAGQQFEIYDNAKRKSHDDYITIGFAGRYCSWKGWNRVVEICEKIETFDDIRVEIVLGCLTDSDLRHGKEIESCIRDILGSRFQCHFNYQIEEMDEFYYGIDVFVITSDPHSESFGRVLVEAMSRHVAILGTDCGGATEVMGDKKRICYSTDQFVEKIVAFSHNRELLKEEQDNCYERYVRNYSVNNNVSKHKKLYEELLN